MIDYLKGLIPKVQKFSKSLDVKTSIADKNWILQNEFSSEKKVLIFKSNGEVLISENGIVNKGSWEYLLSGSILLSIKENTILFSKGYIEKDLVILQQDGIENYFILRRDNFNGVEMSTKKPTGEITRKLTLGNTESYEVIQKTDGWGGRFTQIEILFVDGTRGKILFDKESNLYTHNYLKSNESFRSKESCIYNLRSYLLKR